MREPVGYNSDWCHASKGLAGTTLGQASAVRKAPIV